jgi:vacuolar protein sorting-associated protein 13A/C
VIQFAPRYVVKNNTTEDFECRVLGTGKAIAIPSEAMRPVYHLQANTDLLMTIRQQQLFDEWSAPFNFNNLGKVYVKLTKLSHTRDALIRVEIGLEGPTVFIVISVEDKNWPYRIDNLSSTDVVVYQRV